nr:type 1 glutamine amidotransferase [Nocardioides panaciterrulae]
MCPPALIGRWLVDAGCTVEVCRPYAGDELPDPAAYDGLVVLGGSMGANDDAEHRWLGPVKDRVRAAATAEVPTLGVCLGHQLAAVALGGTVGVNPRGQQLGLLDVGWHERAADDPLFAPVATPRRGVHWNNDVVLTPPPGAVVLARSGGDVQVARHAATVWGVQLHPEADLEVVRPWAASDEGSHRARGIDQEALLRDIDVARTELDEAWRPLAASFAALARARARASVPATDR